MRRRERGQATVEFAITVPLLALVALMLLEVALIGRDRIALEHAARAAARQAVIDPAAAPVAAAARAATALDAARLAVAVEGSGRPDTLVKVTVTYRSPVHVPALRALARGPTLEASLWARVEHPPIPGASRRAS